MPSFMSTQITALRSLAAGGTVTVITGTGFIVSYEDTLYLVTNGHIVTGRHRVKDCYLNRSVPALPENLRVLVPISGTGEGDDEPALLGLRPVTVPLYDEDDRALWFVHPQMGRRFDVVAVPLGEAFASKAGPLRTEVIPYSLATHADKAELSPPQDVSVVGFPFGLTAGANSAIWVRGTIASEPEVGFEGDPCFLIDARTRDGQSGSPVIVQGDAAAARDSAANEWPWRLAGIYSGRTDKASDLGRVWPVSVLLSILKSRERDNLTVI